MGRRTKTIILILLALAALAVIFAVGSSKLFLGSFVRIETRNMQTEVERARESIQYELDQLDTITTDYSGWDEAYGFVLDRNPAFIKSNLADAVYTKLRINLIAYLDRSGRMVYSRMYDYRNNREVPLPADLSAQLRSGAPLVTHATPEASRKGFLVTAGGILMVSSRPILTSEFKGPQRGTLVMARYLDAQELTAIATRTRRTISVHPIGTPGHSAEICLPASHAEQLGTVHIVSDRTTINGYGHFHDISGKDAFMLKVSSPRTISAQGQSTVDSFIVLFICMTVLGAGGMYVVFERLTSSLRRQRESEMQYHTLVERAAEGIVIATLDGLYILDANAAFAALTGSSLQDMRGCSLLDYFSGPRSEVAEEFTRTLTEMREMRISHSSGTAVTVEVNACQINRDGQPVLSLLIHNVTERKSFEDQLMYQANHDPLTGLPNRILLNDRLTHALSAARRENGRIVLMLLDLDHFKVVNDTMGHSFGDQLLCSAAQRLQKLVRASDTIARIGGDEFVIVLAAMHSRDDVIDIATRFLEEVSKPYRIQDQEINLSTSIGIAQYPDDGDTAELLFKKADTAMYHVKERGRNGIQFYAEEMNLRANRHLMIESRLRHAIELGELDLNYQPQIHLGTGNIVGMEVLLRWTNSELGPVSPADFIPVAEDTGMIVPLGKWALQTACRQYVQWMAEGFPKLRMAVNLSPRQFAQKDLVEMVRDVLQTTGIEPGLLDLEVTESLMMNNIEDSIEKMLALKQLGVHLSIDDFGTGYSSLSCLQRFPLDILKVDRTFVNGIGYGNKSVIIRAIVAMAHSLGLSVIAEGVETVEQLNFLRNHRCEEVQGFYFSPPLSAAMFSALITTSADYDSLGAACGVPREADSDGLGLAQDAAA